MAGRGRRPKDPDRRARTNADPIPTTKLKFVAASQPPLPRPPRWLKAWPPQTRRWWAIWAMAPQAEHLSATDWDFLVDTALVHAAVWGRGDLKVLPELRLRVAKFGATLEDRARLRMQFAQADEADANRSPAGRPTAQERLGALHALPSPAADTAG